MFGLLNLDKPAGVTSRDVVNRVQRLARPCKAGHAGTLDPLATGVLIICVGQATRLIEYIQERPKRYRATFLLGRESDTEDIEGQVVELAHPPQPTSEQVRRALGGFVGEIPQVPPQFSALKVKGKRAYELARRGASVPLAPRGVTIYSLDLVAYDYPELCLRIECGSGTYIRSLGRDLAHSLGTAAVMSGLRREAIGPFNANDAVLPDQLEPGNLATHLIPACRAVAHLPHVELNDMQRADVAHGRSIALPARDVTSDTAALGGGQLVAILRRRPDGRFGPVRNFSPVP